MATLILNSSNWEVAQLRITYTASNGTLKITEIEGKRSSTRSWNKSHQSISVSVGGVKKTISLSHYIDFDTSWTDWGATDTTWTGLSGSSISISITMPSSTTSYSEAKFSGNITMSLSTYTVTYNANGGTGVPSSQTKTYGKTLTLSSTKPTRTGYNFVKWNTKSDGSGTSYSSGGSYTKNASVTLYAIWKKKTYTVTYNSNGGTGAPSKQTKIYGITLTLSSTKPTRTGYDFVKWNTKSDGSGTSYSSKGSYTSNASITLYAQWKKKTYTVKYNANGGTGAPSSQTKTYGVALTLSSTKPTRTSEDSNITYTFKGWNTSSAATSISYKAGGSYTNNASVTLYAVWSTTTSYDIVYNANGGKNAPSTQTKEKGATITLSTKTPTRSGYNFVKWNTKPDGSGTSYSSGNSYSTNDDIVLYAIWSPYTHTVKYDANGGSGIPSSFSKSTGEDTVISETEPIRDGYVFKYWNTKSDGSGSKYVPGDSYEYNQNGGTVTLYAIWVSADILIYKTAKCKAVYFVEGSENISFNSKGVVSCFEFIENMSISSPVFSKEFVRFKEIIEK